MPVYTYKCLVCHVTTEVQQRIRDEPLKECACGGELQRIILPSTVVFKGDGWTERG